MDDKDYEVMERDNSGGNGGAGSNNAGLGLLIAGAILCFTGGGLPIGIALLAVGIHKMNKNKERHGGTSPNALPNRYYSQRLIPAMKKAFGESFMVDRRAGISADHVWKSGLFVKQQNCERKGVAGAKYRGIDTKIGWIETYETERTQDVNGNYYYARRDRFRGMMLTMQTKQEAPCAFKIMGNDYPDKGELCEPGMCRMILGNDDIDKNFLLFTDNARALEGLLTPDNCRALMKLIELAGNRKVAVSWRGHLCYAAWDSYSNMLDLPVVPDPNEEADNADQAVYYITDFVDTCGTFIW